MKNVKKLLIILLAIVITVMAVLFVACNNNSTPNSDNETPSTEQNKTDDDNGTVVKKKSLIQQRNEAYEAEGKVKWYDYNDKEYSFGKLSFATILIDPGCISYSWEELYRGYDMRFSAETENTIKSEVKDKLYSNYGLAEEKVSGVFLSFFDISNEFIDNKIKYYYEICGIEDEAALEMREDLDLTNKVYEIGTFENEDIKVDTFVYDRWLSRKSLLFALAMYEYVCPIFEVNAVGIYLGETLFGNAIYYTLIECKDTGQKYAFAFNLCLSLEYSNAISKRVDASDDGDAVKDEEMRKYLDIVKPYVDEVVNGYLLEEFGVVL